MINFDLYLSKFWTQVVGGLLCELWWLLNAASCIKYTIVDWLVVNSNFSCRNRIKVFNVTFNNIFSNIVAVSFIDLGNRSTQRKLRYSWNIVESGIKHHNPNQVVGGLLCELWWLLNAASCVKYTIVDWLVVNSNFSCISAISGSEQIILII
jgi:hypothetical protein